MKKQLLTLLLLAISFTATADEGMWLPSLISQRIGDMRAKGFRLTAEDIYSINKASIKDAVVLFDGGCTGELISAEGLLLTNHHCGYDIIQALSSVENDFLTHGFWAMDRASELPTKGLNVRFLVRMDDITDRLAKGETAKQIIDQAASEGVGYKATIEQMYYGNQHFLFVYEQFDDVRLVGSPPSSIGKFGGDTDNWIWPRHTGDFSLFRIYANEQNKPAAYSAQNRPYVPARHLTVSTKGVKEDDFTMIYGFPGNTQEYILSDAVKYIAHRSDPAKIAIREGRINLMKAAQESDPALRLHYAAEVASVANAWKKWQGEVLGIERKGTVKTRLDYEQQFANWAQSQPEYSTVVADLKSEYARIMDGYFANEILRETLRAIPAKYSPKVLSEPLFAQCKPTERALCQYLCREYAKRSPADWRIAEFESGVEASGGVDAYADRLFDELCSGGDMPLNKALREGMNHTFKRIDKLLGFRAQRNLNSDSLNKLYTLYIKGLREWDTARAFYPDANLTLRVAYGHVKGYSYADGEYHTPLTTLDGIIAKDDPTIYDYDIPQRLREVYAKKDYGRWAINVNGHTTIPVCFLATNHTTGGNSGSPVLNARGELVGINFDRTWRSTMSDIAFDPAICRNIAVDIRYVLFVVDRIGGASHLFDEMTIK